jgi:uncharacterized membrane protein YccF (DUF307 family)
MKTLRIIANIWWHVVCFGWLTAFLNLLVGVIWIVTIIGIPVGLGLFQYSKFLLAPFSRTIVTKDSLGIKIHPVWRVLGIISWILYLPCGLILCLATVLQIILLCVTILGIPIAVVLAKSLGTYFKPVFKKCISVEVRDEMQIKINSTQPVLA